MKEIFRTVVGSRLYNLHSETSDTDIKGFALPSAEDLLGMSDTARQHWEQPNDTVIYSVTKFFSLLAKGNPTVIELLFVPDEAVLVSTVEALDILEFARKTFVTKAILPAYFGYVSDQFKRVESRKAQNNRTTMIEEHGYDLKCSSHVYRLAVQAVELMTTGVCHPRMSGTDRQVALDMKRGKYTYEQTMDILTIAFSGMKAAESKCKLPESPDMAAVNDYVVALHRRVILADSI